MSQLKRFGFSNGLVTKKFSAQLTVLITKIYYDFCFHSSLPSLPTACDTKAPRTNQRAASAKECLQGNMYSPSHQS